MGKSGNAAVGSAPKAEPKRKGGAAPGDKDKLEAGAKAAPGKGEGKGSKVKETPAKDAAKDAAKDTAKGAATDAAKDNGQPQEAKTDRKADDAQAKLLEEAQQKLTDDERDEAARVELRELNRKARAAEPQLSGNRDKSIARVTRFQNKLRLFKGESELASVTSDINGVDASKYVSELAECMIEAAGTTLKLKELSAGVKVCSRLHATYGEFSGLLSKALDRAYRATPATDLNRRRLLFRMCAELCLVECVPADSAPLLDIVRELTDISLPEDQVITNLMIISSLVQKHAISCLAIVPAKQKAYEEALGRAWPERRCVLSDSLRAQVATCVVNAYQSTAAGLLQGAHSRLIEQEKVNTKLRVDKGQVDPENQQKHEQIKEALTKLQGILSTLSEHLNQPMPTPEEIDPNISRIEGSQDQKDDGLNQEEELQMIWEDTEQQNYYEDILDPKDVIPAVLLNAGKVSTIDTVPGDGEKDDSKEEKPKEKKAEAKEDAKAQHASDFELYLLRLGKVETAKQVDDIATEFFHEFNTKGNRRAVAATLLGVQRTKLHLLAPHARFMAVVNPYLKDIAVYVLAGLQQELEQMVAEKDPILIESKVKTVRFLCELCKFKICPPGTVLDMFKVFCDEFSHHHAELSAHILQCCGRFLLYTPETQVRTDNLLERMMRLKNAKSLPLRLEIMLEDSYYQVKPPEGKRQKMKQKDPLELFTQNLIFERLYREDDEDKVLKWVRKLPWDGPAVGYLRKALLDLNMHANYDSLHLIASLLSGLAKYRDAFVIEVIDNLFENMQTSIERNDFREMPLRVRQTKLLGELYNYRLVDSNLIFDTMYQYIGFGGPTTHRAAQTATAHKIIERANIVRKNNLGTIDEAGSEDAAGHLLPQILADPQHPLEAPWDYFRIKLVCVLLETCGHYFDRGAVKQKLDRFLNFFVRYVHTKGDLPLRFMNMVHDTLERLRPKLVFPETKAAADEAVLQLIRAERETLDLGEGKAGEREEEANEDDDSTDDDESGSEDEDGSSNEEDSDEGSTSDEDDTDAYDRGEGAAGKHAGELEEFDRELQQMRLESLEREKHAPRVLSELPTPPPAAKRPEGPGGSGMFSLMQKKTGGKMLMRHIEVPEDSKLMQVSQTIQKDEASKEKEDLKRYIMNYDQMSSAPPPARSVIGLRPDAGMRTRMGKGGHKGGYHSDSRGKKNNYVKDEFLPEDDRSEPSIPHGRTLHIGGGKGGGRSSGGGGSRRSGDSRGTPSQPGVRGTL